MAMSCFMDQSMDDGIFDIGLNDHRRNACEFLINFGIDLDPVIKFIVKPEFFDFDVMRDGINLISKRDY